jgi:hypothetical protein
VSNGNALIESLFKTLKNTPWYPTVGFKNFDECRHWTQQFVQYYNALHRHKGITWVTSLERHDKLDVEILQRRSMVDAAARQTNPNRWSGEVTQWTNIKTVTLNGKKKPNNAKNAETLTTAILQGTDA